MTDIRTNYCVACKEMADRIEALETENARLREALEWYVAEDEKYIRAALGGETK